MNTYDKGIWAKLEREAASDENPDKYSIVACFRRNTIFCMIDRYGNPGLIIRHLDSGKKYREMAPSRGFNVTICPLPIDGVKYQELRISISGKEYSDPFMTFTENLILCLRNLPEESDFIKYATDHLFKWQKFMEMIPNDKPLSVNQCKGLYGELHFLYNTLIPLIGIRAAVKSWFGPDMKQQDFLLSNNVGVEVKTTSSKAPVSISISSEEQLNPSGFTSLYLYHNDIREAQDTENTLVSLVDKISEKCTEDDYGVKMEFMMKLAGLNYRERDRDYYSQQGYHIKNETAYLVSGDFPNITHADLKHGVGNVRYSIQVSALEPFVVDKNKFHESLKEGYN